jgi:hypothetical protein
LEAKFQNKINVEKYHGPRLPVCQLSIFAHPHRALQPTKFFQARKRRTLCVSESATRLTERLQSKSVATTEGGTLTLQVMDPRTRMMLFKMLSRNQISEINGCVSTGKEANVYHANTPEGSHFGVRATQTHLQAPTWRSRSLKLQFLCLRYTYIYIDIYKCVCMGVLIVYNAAGSRPICLWRVPLASRLRKAQPAQNGVDVG